MFVWRTFFEFEDAGLGVAARCGMILGFKKRQY
jgi:hypothetical protein